MRHDPVSLGARQKNGDLGVENAGDLLDGRGQDGIHVYRSGCLMGQSEERQIALGVELGLLLADA